MAYVTSSSTDQQVRDAIDNTSSYDVDSNVTMAKEHVVACRVWLNRHPRGAANQEVSTQFNPDAIQEMLESAQAWVASNAAGNGGVIHASLREFRS